MASEKRVGGQLMHPEWERDAKSKFVVTYEEAWFVTIHEDEETPSLGEMLLAATEVDLSNDAAVRKLDEKLEDGEILLGYVSGEKVEVHSYLGVPYPSVFARLSEVFGDVNVRGVGWTASTGEEI